MACANCQASYSNRSTKIMFSSVILNLFGKPNSRTGSLAFWYVFFLNFSCAGTWDNYLFASHSVGLQMAFPCQTSKCNSVFPSSAFV